MTRIEITIQERNGRKQVTCIEQKGDQLPNDMWNDLNVALISTIERYT